MILDIPNDKYKELLGYISKYKEAEAVARKDPSLMWVADMLDTLTHNLEYILITRIKE